jgi:hypothetical protein
VNHLAPTLDFLTIQSPDLTFDLDRYVSTSSQPVQIEMTFQGLTFVDFGPVPFDPATDTNWFWMAPILEAIRNTGQNVSGFRFSQPPPIDFSQNGSFGFVTRVGLTKYPSISVTAPAPPQPSLRQELLASPVARVTVAAQTPNEDYTVSEVDGSTGSFSVKFTPPADPGSVDSTAFVVGVNTSYPGSGT